jgi:hypothetical protein
MKRFIITLLCFFAVCGFAQAGCVMGSGQSTAAVAAHCASGCTPDDADIACLDFETIDDPECSFAETIGEGASISYVADPTGTYSCKDSTHVMEVVAKDTTATYIKRDMGATKLTLAVQFYFQIKSESLANGELYRLFYAELVDESTSSMRVSIVDTSDVLYLHYYLNQGSDISVTSTTAIALNTWYRVRIYFVDETTLKVHLASHDGTAIETLYDSDVSGAPSSSVVPRYLYFAGHGIAAVGDVTLQMDNIKVSSTAEITTGCAQ